MSERSLIADGQAAERRAAELRHISDAIDCVRTFKQADDAFTAARNLSQMLEEARARGIKKTTVARTVWPHDEGDAAKRFDKITISRKHEQNMERVERLQKRSNNYARVAKVLGELVDGWSPDEALVRVFRNTAVDRELNQIILGFNARATDPSSCWRSVAEMMASLGTAIVRDYNLSEHFILIAQTPGRYDLALNEIAAASFDIVSGGDRMLPYGPLSHNFALWDHYPPIPSVLLFEQLLAGPFLHSLDLVDSTTGKRSSLELRAQVWREMRLSIGPVDSIERAGTLFEIRARVDLMRQGAEVTLHRPWLYLNHPEEVLVSIDGLEFTTTIDFGEHSPDGIAWSHLLGWKALGFQNSDVQPEHSYIAWRPTTSQTCEEELSRPTQFEQEIEFRIPDYERSNEPTEAPDHTLGALIELALRAEGPDSIANRLGADARRVTDIVQNYARQRRCDAIRLNTDTIAKRKAPQ